MIKVLIVEDSRVAQEFLVHVLTSDPAVLVVGVVNDGVEALAAVKAKRPDVITMDIHMPKMDGYEATRTIMESAPAPIVIVSASTSATETSATFRALEAGALAVVLRPPGIGHPGYAAAARELVQTVKLMSEIKVVRRFARPTKEPAPLLAPASPVAPTLTSAADIQVIAIGASTGGPPVLHTILSSLPPDLPVPVLIVQHIAPGFVAGFVEWLTGAAKFPVHIATHGQLTLPGHGYVAPDGFHMGIASGPRIVLSNQAPENGLRPAVGYLFRSVAQVMGAHAVGILLTGMGRDGAEELKVMKDRGALTIAQDEVSSIVHGMPGEAIKLGAATHVLPPESIAAMLTDLIHKTNGVPR
jgi:two-component system chemotaxis response regulator CheB